MLLDVSVSVHPVVLRPRLRLQGWWRPLNHERFSEVFEHKHIFSSSIGVLEVGNNKEWRRLYRLTISAAITDFLDDGIELSASRVQKFT